MKHPSLRFNPATGRIRVADVANLNSLGKILGYQRNDEIVTINSEQITAANANNYFRNFGSKSKQGDSLIIKVIRKDEKGNDTPIELRAAMTKFPIMKFNVLEFNTNATKEQIALREAWLKPNDMQTK